MIPLVLTVLCAYLLGAVPFAYIFCRAINGSDIREHGSGNVGATNASRVIGKGPAAAVFALDLSKGALAVTLLPLALGKILPGSPPGGDLVRILAGGAAIAGHIWPVYIGFNGGKGVSTTAGVMAGLSPVIFLSALFVWAVVFFLWKYVSAASIAAAVSLPLIAVITGKGIGFVLFCALICMVGVYAHRANIKRLMMGTETRIVRVKKR